MKAYLLITLTTLLVFPAWADNQEMEKIKETAVQDWQHLKADVEGDQALLEKYQKQDQAKVQKMPMSQVMAQMGLANLAPHNDCNSDPSNPVQKHCWTKCDQDGWSVDYCVKQCGVSASEGSEQCWAKCDKDGWSVDYCTGKCEVALESGSQKCWAKCDKDGWSVDYCTGKCGTGKALGSEACWVKCDKDGWSVDYCTGKCKVDSAEGSSACWDKCGKDGWSVSYCTSKCGTGN